VIQQNSLIIIAALLVIAVVLAVVAMRGRSRRAVAVPPQAGAAPVFCGKCGTENPVSNEFCVNCGNKLKSS
jgi:Flp pilus assembly protein CpaB